MMIQSQPVLISDFLKRNYFIIPSYQRPYKWTKDECETLWNDIQKRFEEKINGNNQDYFFGSVVVFKRDDGKYEIIDGQQRITTFTLLFRAFYETFKTENKISKSRLSEDFARCIWTCELNDDDNGINIIYKNRRLNSEVINDIDKVILDNILDDSNINEVEKNNKSNYLINYMYFYDRLTDLKAKQSLDYQNFCKLFLEENFNKGGFYILPIICDNQETALTIFNTLNSRGLPLTNSDLIKGYLYEYYKNNDEKRNEFLNIWKKIESKVEEDYTKQIKDGLDTLFLQLMYIIKAENEDKSLTTYNILDFFTKTSNESFYGAHGRWLYKEDILLFLENLTNFWINPLDYLTINAYAYIKILKTFSNDTWKYYVAYLVWRNKELMYKISNMNGSGEKEYKEVKEEFSKDFNKYLPILIKKLIIALLKGNAGTSVVTKIVVADNVDIKKSLTLSRENMVSEQLFFESVNNFGPNKIRFILYVYSYIYDNFSDSIINLNEELHIEHILPKSWQKANFDDWTEETHQEYLENIGNKILLDYKINIACGNNFFTKKKDEYKKSKLKEVQDLGYSEKDKWLIEDIKQRASEMYKKIKEFVEN